jgi:phage gpG-like protein
MGGFKSNSSKWFANESKVLRRAVGKMAATIVIRGILLAPRDKGDLQQSGRVEEENGIVSAVFGGNGVPYGRIHELGGVTGRDYKTKIVAKHYLKRAGDSVAKESLKKYVDMSR